MTEAGFWAVVVLVSASCIGEPDLIDSIIYQMTGEKNWEETID